MEQIVFDTGLREYKINEHGILRFNPSDPNLYARFFSATDKIKDVEKEMSEKAKTIPENNGSESGEAVLQIMRETDEKIKKVLNDIFGHGNDFDKILEGINLMAVATNGKRVVENLLEALQPIMEAGAKECTNSEVESAKLNREQRRALQ